MNIKCSTGTIATNNKGLIDLSISLIQEELSWIKDRVTLVKIHLAAEKGNNANLQEAYCILEAKLEGMQYFAVVDHSSSIEQAIFGAISRLKSSIKTYLWKNRSYAYKHTSTLTS